MKYVASFTDNYICAYRGGAVEEVCCRAECDSLADVYKLAFCLLTGLKSWEECADQIFESIGEDTKAHYMNNPEELGKCLLDAYYDAADFTDGSPFLYHLEKEDGTVIDDVGMDFLEGTEDRTGRGHWGIDIRNIDGINYTILDEFLLEDRSYDDDDYDDDDDDDDYDDEDTEEDE